MRLFTAIVLPDFVKEKLYASTQCIKSKVLNGNFSSADNYHITLVFLGDVNEKNIPLIKTIITETAGKSLPLYLKCLDADFFQRRYRKILYYNIGGNINTLDRIQKNLYDEFYKAKLCRKQDNFIPHITFARNVKYDDTIKTDIDISFTSGKITLMHSKRINNRLTYLPIFEKSVNGLFTIDRIEEDTAVCEYDENLFFNIKLVNLPEGVLSGSKIRYNGLEYKIDKNAMSAAKKLIRSRFDALKGG